MMDRHEHHTHEMRDSNSHPDVCLSSCVHLPLLFFSFERPQVDFLVVSQLPIQRPEEYRRIFLRVGHQETSSCRPFGLFRLFSEHFSRVRADRPLLVRNRAGASGRMSFNRFLAAAAESRSLVRLSCSGGLMKSSQKRDG